MGGSDDDDFVEGEQSDQQTVVKNNDDEKKTDEKANLGTSKTSLSSTVSSGTNTPCPPELARSRAGVITSRPGAMHVPGLLNQATRQDDEESAVTYGVDQHVAVPQQEEVLLTAELVVPPSQQVENGGHVTAQVSPGPVSTSTEPTLSLVHAEPLSERQIGLRDIMKIRSVRIAMLVCLILVVVIVSTVTTVVVELRPHSEGPNTALIRDNSTRTSPSKIYPHGQATNSPSPAPSYSPTSSTKPHSGGTGSPVPSPTISGGGNSSTDSRPTHNESRMV